MKLKLPFALLAALLVSVNQAVAESTEGGNTAPSTTVLNPVEDGGVTNKGSNYYLSQDVTWQQDYNYDKGGTSTVLSVGTLYGDGSLSVENASTVNVAGSLHIGGWGWGSGYDSAIDPPHSGEVYVGEGSVIAVGAASGVHYTNSQLNIGAGGDKNKGASASMVVDGGTVSTNYALNVGLGNGAKGELTIQNGGKVIVQAGTNSYASSAFYVGYYEGSEGKVTVEGEGSTLEVGAKSNGYAMTYMGLGDSTGVLEVKDGATVNLMTSGSALTVLGYDSQGSGVINVEGANLISSDTYVGYAGDGEMHISQGADVDVNGQLVVSGWNAGKTGAITVDGSDTTFTVTGNSYIGNAEGTTGSLEISNGAQADMGYVGVLNDSSVAVSGGATANVEHLELVGQSTLTVTEGSKVHASGTMYVEEGASVTISDGETATSSLTVEGTYVNEGTTTLNLTQGGSFSAGRLENSGTMDVNLDGKGTFSVTSFVNDGNSTITATEGTTCQLGSIEMSSGSMKLDGEGSFEVGAPATSDDPDAGPTVTSFTVTPDATTEDSSATSTCIDLSGFTGTNIKVNTDSVYTFRFTDEVLATLRASAGQSADMELVIIKGYAGFELSQIERERMLERTEYLYGSTAAEPVAYTLDAVSSDPWSYEVSNAEYVMVGNDLVWRGTVTAIPEPATATLSLLALAGLCARRRRK